MLPLMGPESKSNAKNATEKANEDSLLTLQEVAAYLRAGRSTVWRICNQPDGLPVVRIGGLPRVLYSDLREYVRKHRT